MALATGAPVTTLPDGSLNGLDLTADTSSSTASNVAAGGDGPGGRAYVRLGDVAAGTAARFRQADASKVGSACTIVAVVRQPYLTPNSAPDTNGKVLGDHSSIMSTSRMHLSMSRTDNTRYPDNQPTATNTVVGSPIGVERLWVDGVEVSNGGKSVGTGWHIITSTITGLGATPATDLFLNRDPSGYGTRVKDVERFGIIPRVLSAAEMNALHAQINTECAGIFTIGDAGVRPPTAAKMHSPLSYLNRIRPMDGSDVDTRADGPKWATRAIRQIKVAKTITVDGVTGHADNDYQLNINKNNYSIAVYQVLPSTPTHKLYYCGWDVIKNASGVVIYSQRIAHPDNEVAGLGHAFDAVPMPPLATVPLGQNHQRKVGVASSAGTTTIGLVKGDGGSNNDDGGVPYLFPAGVQWVIDNGLSTQEVFTNTDSYDTQRASPPTTPSTDPWTWKLTAPLKFAHAVGAQVRRAHQVEADGNDKHLVILQDVLDAQGTYLRTRMWEIHGYRPSTTTLNGAAPDPEGGCFNFGGYVDDFYNWNGVFNYTWGARAYGGSVMGGLILVSEFYAALQVNDPKRAIPHMIGMGWAVTGPMYPTVPAPYRDARFVGPANRWDGTSYQDCTPGSGDVVELTRMVMGARWALRRSYADADIEAWATTYAPTGTDGFLWRAVAYAARDYGIGTIDTTTTSGAVYVEDPRAIRAGFGFQGTPVTADITNEWQCKRAFYSLVAHMDFETLLPVLG